MKFAHSLPGIDKSKWEPLSRHLHEVGAMAAEFAQPFGAAGLAQAAGLLHDIGKVSAEFQAYISGDLPKGPDHATAGARAAVEVYGPNIGKLLAFGIAGHHAGLANGNAEGRAGRTLTARLDAAQVSIAAHSDWRDHTGPLPKPSDMALAQFRDAPGRPGFGPAFLTRMLFSCLVDADFLATEKFYANARSEVIERGLGILTGAHLDRLRAAMDARPVPATVINKLRADILAHAVGKADLAPGLFTLTVPTGGGKTLTSLRFALEHAARHGLRRVIYVIPFTSIIEQTAQIFREAFGPVLDGSILEHHSTFDWDKHQPDTDRDLEKEGRDGLAKLRRATENWDAPIIVTTAVQFYESLFAARTSRCRKLHNMAQSVIILDEAQTLPVPLLRPCMAALDELTLNYGASVVLCTATQPALRKVDGALPANVKGEAQGFDLDDGRELAPDPPSLYRQLRRVTVEHRREPVADAEIAARFGEAPQMLCVVNSRGHARDLFEAIRPLPGARHLTTLMCARHRREVLAGVRDDLAAQRPVRLVATSLIEAGVDVDFPEVWRAVTGLDSIAQAAGRCNREGKLSGAGGRVVVFEPDPAAHKTPRAILSFWQAARAVLGRYDDPLGHAAVKSYFSELYFQRGYEALDKAARDGNPYPIMPAIAETARGLNFPFANIAEAFRLIDDIMDPVLIPFDDKARAALKELGAADRPPRDALRRLQQYSVPVLGKARAVLIAAGAAEAIRSQEFGDRFVVLTSEDLYDAALGLRLDDPMFRASEWNVI